MLNGLQQLHKLRFLFAQAFNQIPDRQAQALTSGKDVLVAFIALASAATHAEGTSCKLIITVASCCEKDITCV